MDFVAPSRGTDESGWTAKVLKGLDVEIGEGAEGGEG